MDDAPPPPAPLDPGATGSSPEIGAGDAPTRRRVARLRRFRRRAAALLRVIGFDDPAITAAALLGLGEAPYRLDARPAVASWVAALELPETPATYPAWRNVAAARVRAGDLKGAIAAYREADRRAPRQDKAEIASASAG